MEEPTLEELQEALLLLPLMIMMLPLTNMVRKPSPYLQHFRKSIFFCILFIEISIQKCKLFVSLMTSSSHIIGFRREPKFGHLKELHKVIKQCEKALLNADPTVTSLGSHEEVSQLI